MADNGLKEHDPYRGMETGEQGIRPDFLSGSGSDDGGGVVVSGGGSNAGGGGGGFGVGRVNRKKAGNYDAAKNLSSAEKAAADSSVNGGEAGLYNAQKNENQVGGLYKGEGVNDRVSKVTGAAKDIKKGNIKGALKKGGPGAAILLVIFLVGGLLMGSQAFQPFSLIAQFQETFNSMHTSVNARSKRFLKWQLDSGRVKDPVVGTVFGKSKFKITEKQTEELKKQGIEYDKSENVMKFKGSDGKEIKVGAGDFEKVYNSNPEFRNAYSSGSMTWRGQFANWFGTNTSNFIKNNKLTRNLFNNFKEKKQAADGDGLKVAKELMSERAKGGGDVEIRTTDKDSETTTNADGEETEEDILKNNSEKISGGDVRAKLEKISNKFGSAANVGCAFVGAVGAVTLMVQAAELLQIINITMPYFEAFDKTKAGYGDESPINELSQTLNETKSSSYELVDGAGTGTVTEESKNKSAMQSAGVAALYGGGKVNPNDPSVRSFNLQSSMSNILGGVGASMEAFENCTIAKTAAAAISAIVTGVEIAACFAGILGAAFTFGISAGACGPLAANIAAQAGLSVALSVALGGLVELLTPVVASMLERDLVENLGGEDLGNVLTSGSNIYQGGVHRASGGSLADIGKYEQFAMEQQRVIAENAREERETLSPFDITSKYTFMGALMTQLMAFNTSSSLMGTVTSASSVMSSSLIGLTTSTASAYDIAASLPDMDEYKETCPYLASINAIGDSYCNPYIITDMETGSGGTIDKQPAEIIEQVKDSLEDNETSDGNVIIKKDSALAKYIIYCDNRESAFGVADYNIANEIGNFGTVSTGNSLVDNAGNGLIGGIPVIGDVVEIIDNEQQRNNMGYISGESCVAGNNVSASESPNWNTAKYYQRFIEDQSLAESMGLIDKSAVTAYLEEYYQENPLDDSYEGMLARYSGMDKETVSDILDVIAYYNYVGSYDPSERYVFGEPEVSEEERVVMFDEEMVMDGMSTALEGVVYFDVRNRNFVV